MALTPDHEPRSGASAQRGRPAASACWQAGTFTLPATGRIRLVQQRISVVLPAPFGPRTAVNTPCLAFNDSPSSTARPLNLTTKSSTRTALSGLGTDEF